MTTCDMHTSGDLDLYFYDELNAAERRTVEAHLSVCSECRAALDELRVIREGRWRPGDVSAPASGDWSALHDAAGRVAGSGPPALDSRSLPLKPSSGRRMSNTSRWPRCWRS
jgi:anti-sigma factor RsiW